MFCDTMLVVMRMFLEPIRDGLMRTLETAGVDGVAVRTKKVTRVRPEADHDGPTTLSRS